MKLIFLSIPGLVNLSSATVFFMWILLALRRGCSNKKSGHKVDDTLRIE